ncbi:MAG: hypothetical protein IBJ03_10645 [Gemmatimonadaceae bacterium]|nr:hypothetical protein [Gemmatimonadaceae bacterium]
MSRPTNAGGSATLAAQPGEVADRKALQGLWYVLLGVLRESESLSPVPDFVAEYLAPFASRLPLPMTGRQAEDPVYDWISAAAVIESQGYLDEAWEMLNALEERLSVGSTIRSDVERDEVLAFLSTRRGRIARTGARLDDAEQWYRDAMRRSSRLPREVRWIDALPNALLGLGILHVERGNYPVAKKMVLRILAPSSLSSAFYRVQAHMLQTLLLRKSGQLHDALAAIWSAHDLLAEGDARHADVLTTLAEVAVELGAVVPAVRARLAVLAYTTSPRLAVASLSGTLTLLSGAPDEVRRMCEAEIARSAWGRHVLSRREEATVSERVLSATQQWLADPPERGLTPYDVVYLSLGVARLALRLGQFDDAMHAVADARALSIDRKFNEWVFECDALSDRIESARRVAASNERDRQVARTASDDLTAESWTTPDISVVKGAALRRLLSFEHEHRLDGRAVFL